ncbi:restriction endonuclease [Paenibacillus sp. UY79]|nr:restriction endonuclease [Paenibacillus farraposensis]
MKPSLNSFIFIMNEEFISAFAICRRLRFMRKTRQNRFRSEKFVCNFKNEVWMSKRELVSKLRELIRKNVGLKAVQEVQGTRAHYKASEAWVVTNSKFTQQAFQLARSNGVRLIDRDELVEMLLQMKEKMSPSKKSNLGTKTSA